MKQKFRRMSPAIFRFTFRRMCSKLKFFPRSRKWMTCLGIVVFLCTSCLLVFRIRSEDRHRSLVPGPLPATRRHLDRASPQVGIHHGLALHYKLNERGVCRDGEGATGRPAPPFLLIFVSSAPKHSDRRLAIRQAWADGRAVSAWGVAVVFLIGATDDPDGQTLLDDESSRFHDIVQGDFVDSYRNLSIKSIMGLNWTREFCAGAQYVMKTDDDVYVNVELLVEFLRVHGRRRWIGGCIKQVRSPAPLDRRGRPVALVVGHPPFAAGAGYVLSGDIVADLYEAALHRKVVPVEDAFVTAYCARAIGVRPSHYEGFNCGEPVFDDCQMRHKFVGHHVSPQRQSQIWSALHDDQSLCNVLRS